MDVGPAATRVESVLREAGFTSQNSLTPLFAPTRGAEHALMRWLADNLSMDNYMSSEDLALAAELTKSNHSAFERTNPNEASDLSMAIDQDSHEDLGNSTLSWLEDDSIASLQSAHMSVQLGADLAAAQELDVQLDARLKGLQMALVDVQQLVSKHAARWLVVAADRDMGAYMQQDACLTEQLHRLKHLLHDNGTGEGSRKLGSHHLASRAMSASVSVQDCLSWDNQQVNGSSSVADELYRLRFAYTLGEQQYIEAVANKAASKAMLEAASQQTSHTELTEHCTAGLRSEFRVLLEEQSR
eukprot:gene25891-11564_t